MLGSKRVSRETEEEAFSHAILEVLWREPDYERRLDALLRSVSELTGLPDSYLYLADESGNHLHLIQSRAKHGPAGSSAPPPPAMGEEAPVGGAEASAPSPGFELLAGDEERHDRIVATPVGRLFSLALRSNGTLLGLVQVGPVDGGELSRDAQRRLELARLPLATVARQAQAEHQLRQQLATVTTQLDGAQKLAGSALDLDRMIGLLLNLALGATQSDAGFVAIVEPGSGRIQVRAQSGLPPDFNQQIDLSPETGLFDWMLEGEGGSLFLRDVEAARRFGIESLIAVPLVEANEPLGIFALANFGASRTFELDSLELLATFSEQVRLMLHNERLFDTFRDRYLETVEGLAGALDARHPHTRDHHPSVSRVAAALAAELGLPGDEVEAIRVAGLIHDVGMAGVSGIEGAAAVDIDHPSVGAGLVEHLPLHHLVAESVATHHEWFDGWGFPKGLREEEIPVGGRVIAISEFLVEMANGDPVRPAWSTDELVNEVEHRRRSQFDPRVADVAVHMLRAGGLPLSTNASQKEA